jgi:UDP-2,3-diacylglucosamine hydrolase
MSPKRLHEGAILVADSHYAPWNPLFFDFLTAIAQGKITTTQLILMGDNCDLLFAPIEETVKLNQAIITLLNSLSQIIEILYLEGNHDFQLSPLFPHISVISRAQQPLIAQYGSNTIALLHGDIGGSWGYGLYTALIRNRVILYGLNLLNTWLKGAIIAKLSTQMQRKKHAHTIDHFETIAYRPQLRLAGCNWVIEGHYHQNRQFHCDEYHYCNLGAFTLGGYYYKITSDRGLIEEYHYSKGKHNEPKTN